jgi:DNA-binding SARP family transcriptional activator
MHAHVALDGDDQPRPFAELVPPILVCLLGTFRVLKSRAPVQLRGGVKGENLLMALALGPTYGVSRDELTGRLWPDAQATLAAQSMNSLIYSLHRLLGDAIEGASPIVYEEGAYRLNWAAGIELDIRMFDRLTDAGRAHQRAGDNAAATACFQQAVACYRGDLCISVDAQAVIERERLRAQCLNMLAFLADYHFAEGNHSRALDESLALLARDPCREDAHRLVMRCYARRGDRSQALRQYRICESVLRREFNATPEPATVELFNQLRTQPETL